MKLLHDAKKICNLFLGFFAYNYRVIKSINSPTVLLIETTNNCNLRCSICPRREMTRKIVDMPFWLFKKIIDETKNYTRFIWLHHIGEPLIDPLLEKRIVYCKKNNIGVGISTNATLLTKKKSEMLFRSGLDKIIICIDGVKKETYEKIRRNGNFEKTVNNIKTFLKMKEKTVNNNLYTMMQVIYMNETKEQIKAFKEIWGKYDVDEIVVKNFNTWGSQVGGIKELSKSEFGYFKERHTKYRIPCYYLWHSLVVLSDGRVVPCCREYDAKIVLGDIKNQSLGDIWNGKSLQRLRREHLEGKFNNDVCDHCIEYPDIQPTKLLFTFNNIKRGIRHIIRKSVG